MPDELIEIAGGVKVPLTWIHHVQEDCWCALAGRQVWTIYPDGLQVKITGYPRSPGVYCNTLAVAQAWCQRESELAAEPK